MSIMKIMLGLTKMSIFTGLRNRVSAFKKKYVFQKVEKVKTVPLLEPEPIQTKQKLNLYYKPNLNLIIAKGESTALEVMPAYRKLTKQVISHFESSDRLTCYFHYSVINATTVKLLFNLFEIMQKAHVNGKKISVNWMVDENNPEMERAGMQLTKFIEFNFRILIS